MISYEVISWSSAIIMQCNAIDDTVKLRATPIGKFDRWSIGEWRDIGMKVQGPQVCSLQFVCTTHIIF